MMMEEAKWVTFFLLQRPKQRIKEVAVNVVIFYFILFYFWFFPERYGIQITFLIKRWSQLMMVHAL